MRLGSAIISPAAAMSRRESWVGVSSPPSGSPMILAPLYVFPQPHHVFDRFALIFRLLVILDFVPFFRYLVLILLECLCLASFC